MSGDYNILMYIVHATVAKHGEIKNTIEIWGNFKTMQLMSARSIQHFDAKAQLKFGEILEQLLDCITTT